MLYNERISIVMVSVKILRLLLPKLNPKHRLKNVAPIQKHKFCVLSKVRKFKKNYLSLLNNFLSNE